MLDAEKYNWDKFEENIKEAKAIRKDISTVRGIVNDALKSYIKKTDRRQEQKAGRRHGFNVQGSGAVPKRRRYSRCIRVGIYNRKRNGSADVFLA